MAVPGDESHAAPTAKYWFRQVLQPCVATFGGFVQ
jgi:hypothetical protein